MKKRIKDLLWGLAVVVTGIGFLGENVGWWTGFKDVFSNIWWAVLIILIGLSTLIDAVSLLGTAVFIVGIYLLVSRLFSIASIGAVIIPILVIAVGLSIVFGGNKKSGKKDDKTVFDGKNMKFDGEIKDGETLKTTFGGVKADFSACTVSKNVTVYAKSVFGGIEIILPQNVNVTMSGKSVFGGAESRKNEVQENAFNVHIIYECVFGGLEVK